MFVPELYPQPNNYLLSAGFFEADRGVEVYIDENAAIDKPYALFALNHLPGNCALTQDMNSARVIIRPMEEKDIDFASSFFKRDYKAPKQWNDAFFFQVTEAKIVIAAACRRGFYYALMALGKLAPAYSNGVKTGVFFDYAWLRIRAVNLLEASCGDSMLLMNLIGVLADLKYNTVIINWERAGITAQGDRDELLKRCEENCIYVVNQAGEAEGVIQDFHGPSFLDWEHKSKLPGIAGAAVPFAGDLNEAEMIRSGFLYNLVFSATMLWYDEYNNFSWDNVVEPAMRQALAAIGALHGKKPVPPFAKADIYPALLCFEGERHLQRPEKVVMAGQSLVVSAIDEKADGFLFSHTLEAPQPSAQEFGERHVGWYTVRYQDGTAIEIPLTENENIGRDNVWCGRRYNAKTHLFDSDARLHRLCCRTRPIKKSLSDGRLAMVYELEWENPEPSRLIDRVELFVLHEAGAAVCVYGLDIINKTMMVGEQA